MVSYEVLWINGIPVSIGVSSALSILTIMTGTNLDFNNNWKIEFGAYAKTHEPPNPTKSMQSKSKPCICLGLTGNIQWLHWLLNLRTGWHSNQCTFVPLPDQTYIIDWFRELADEYNQNPDLDFCDRQVNPI